jgi:hypothetical protein
VRRTALERLDPACGFEQFRIVICPQLDASVAALAMQNYALHL